MAQRLRARAPLAELLRPRSLDEIVGQDHLVGPGMALRRMVDAQRLTSMIFWGPAGTGKTTLARLVAGSAGYAADSGAGVSRGVKEGSVSLVRARARLGERGQMTVLFIDEVHRFNKSQQDLLLPATENGEIVLIGATTENPYFEVNAALMSRTTLWRLLPLKESDLRTLLARAQDLKQILLSDDAIDALVSSCDGDARSMLTTLDTALILAGGDQLEEPMESTTRHITREHVSLARDGRLVHQSADTHYDQISALIKSVRGSDPDAALYWLVALLEAGESARFIARRLVILASEDVGLADSQALVVAESAARAVEFVGLPEARLTLAHAAIYLSLAPKSNSVTRALAASTEAVRRGGGEVPTRLRDAHYAGAHELGFGDSYLYPHDQPGGWVEQRYLPDSMGETRFFDPSTHGDEARIVRAWRRRRGDADENDESPVE